MNRLGNATSPYLRQHADNPVHWREWDADALAEAAERDVPILLSVGYASCHWCHVMAHESFEDEATAALMNDNFVCIKVDREERPDLDSVYMNATVAMTGQGGWPMTCFLTADGAPFYCGTYYPKVPRGGMPSFAQLLTAITDTWHNRRDDVRQASEQVSEALRAQAGGLPDAEFAVTDELLDHAVRAVLADEDPEHAGFGGAPKFPPSALLEGLLRSAERTGDAEVFAAVDRTAEAMARGGIYDQLRGGFARYSVDAAWVVPHFEKMLYDNAQLLRVYGHLARRGGSSLPLRITRETVGFLLDDLGTAEGGFASALDADTHLEPGGPGVEGATYVWTPAELVGELGPLDGAWAAEVFGVSTAGNFEQGTSVLTRYVDPDDLDRLEQVSAVLRKARDGRPQPARDDKVVTAWNGIAITALIEAGAALGQQDWVDAALRCARFLVAERGAAHSTVHHVLGDETLRRGAVVLARAPRSAGQWLTVAEAALRGPLQVAIAVPESAENTSTATDLATVARIAAPGGTVVVAAPADAVPLLADRPAVGGTAAAYVCRGTVCDLPVTTAEELRASLVR